MTLGRRSRKLSWIAGLATLLVSSTALADGSFAPTAALLAGIQTPSFLPPTSIRVTPPAFGMAFLFDGGVPVAALDKAGTWTVPSGRTYTVTVMQGPIRIWSGSVAAGGGEVNVAFAPLPAAAPPSVPVANNGLGVIPELAFQALMGSIATVPTDHDRVTLVRDFAPHNLFSASHVVAVLGELDSESAKMRVVRALASHVIDPENAEQIALELDSENNRAKVRALFATP